MKSAMVALLLVTSSLHAGESADGTTLLDKLISAPGAYSQVCNPSSAPQDLPFRAYSLNGPRGAWFSKANLAAIKDNGPALVQAIRPRLAAIDLSRQAVSPPIDQTPETSLGGDGFGCDPQTLNPLLLQLIKNLDAIETLPELLSLEDKLTQGIEKAKEDANAPVPVVSGWSVLNLRPQRIGSAGSNISDLHDSLFQARVAQRDLLMLMAQLMRNRAYAPYLTSRLEAAYAKGIRAQVAKNGLTSYKPGEPLPKKLEGVEIDIDPIVKVPKFRYNTVTVSYSREARDEIRAAATKWISEHP
ncbi:MAG: hypothetical protein QM755_03440 [Luteolibacter sp.]